MNRRSFLRQSGAFAGVGLAGLAGCGRRESGPAAGGLPFYDAVGPIAPIRAHVDRIFRTTVCLRPFRAAGPRTDVEHVGNKVVVHNFGHGGSGWSLSWGAADLAVNKAREAATRSRDLAVVGCGALGLTAAITAQRRGFRVTIFAKERPPDVRSSRATGVWSPDSRIALRSAAAPEFGALWEAMARTSFAMYQSYLGLPGTPVEWTDSYILSDIAQSGRDGAEQQGASPGSEKRPEDSPTHDFAHYESRIADITPGVQDLSPGTHPFPTKYASRTSRMTFNVADYSRQLMNDFLIAGGVIETREFQSPQDVASVPQSVIINCPGYGGRKLWSDESIVPVRGQIAWLIPQEDVHYGLLYKDLNVVARRDGIVVQPIPGGDDYGWNDANEEPNRKDAEAGVLLLKELFDRMAAMRG
ncbi:MAG TPA: FAD-dependent oxidoreductase [Vicinamibacterales bacterium]|nr:FAD-dependent oxidoreductase [Vicinamibacterales bacterium]